MNWSKVAKWVLTITGPLNMFLGFLYPNEAGVVIIAVGFALTCMAIYDWMHEHE